MNEDLITRLEAASEGSGRLDEHIWFEIHPHSQPDKYPAYTTSLDAAATLVPEVVAGWAVGIDHGRPVASVGSLRIANGETLALALCIACLKARET
jgi:hypothetical protein